MSLGRTPTGNAFLSHPITSDGPILIPKHMREIQILFSSMLNIAFFSKARGSSTEERKQIVHPVVGVDTDTQKSFATGTGSFRHCSARRRLCVPVASRNMLIAMNLRISLDWFKRWRKGLASALEGGLVRPAGR